MERLSKCWRGENCSTCQDLSDEDLARLQAWYEQAETLKLELVEESK